MSDFHQTGVISTLHRFHTNSLDHIEGQLTEFAPQRPISLVIPALYSDVKQDAMKRIVGDLQHAGYLHQVVITLCEGFRHFCNSAIKGDVTGCVLHAKGDPIDTPNRIG